MKASKTRIILVSGYTLLTCAFATAFVGSLAWFASNISVPKDYIAESKSAFFGGGDGSSDNPYIINNTRHFYNLCWLQYLGKFNEKNNDGTTIDQVYFTLNSDLDFENFGSALPPIGTTKYPFVGNFDGQEHVIKNLTITDEYSQLTFHPAAIDTSGNIYHTSDNDTINYCSIIGTFGVIGYTSSVATDVDDSSIYGFTTAQLAVNSVKNLYVDKITIAPKTSQALAGLLAGYVSANMANCGVHYASFKLGNVTNIDGKFNSKLSRYGLIGDYNSEAYDWDGHGGSDSGDNYGTSIDIHALYSKMSGFSDFTTTTEKSTIPSGYAIPFNFGATSTIDTPTGSPAAVTSSGSSISPSYAKTMTANSSGKNIGYYVGGGIEVYNHVFDSTTVSYDYSAIQTAGNSAISVGDSGISDHLKEIQATLESDDGNGGRKGDNAILFKETVLPEGDSTTTITKASSDYIVLKDAKVGTSDFSDVFLPRSGIWVAPTKPGRFEFIAVNTNTAVSVLANATIAVYRFQRDKSGNDYSKGFLNTEFVVNKGSDFSGGMVGAFIFGGGNAYKPFYYGVNISEEDIENGYEFFITKHNAYFSNPYIVYMDIGATDSGDEPTKTGAIKNVDFVFANASGDLVKISSGDWSDSGVYFEIAGQGTSNLTYFYFKRKDVATGVLYFESVSSGSTLGLTKQGDGTAAKASDANCDSAS